MLDIKVSRNDIDIELTGTKEEIMAELCMAINRIYSTIHKQDRLLAGFFMEQMRHIISDPHSIVCDTDALKGGTGIMISAPNVMEENAEAEEENC